MLTTLTNVSRSGRRLTRTGLFAMQLMAHRRLADSFGAPRRGALRGRARQLAWVAENLAVSYGIEIHAHGRAPSTRAILVAEPAGYLEAITIVSQVPAILLVDRPVGRRLGAPLPRWPIFGPMAHELGVVADVRTMGVAGALRAAGEALDAGVPVLMLSGRPFSIAGLVSRYEAPVIPVAVRADHAQSLRGRLAMTARARTRVDVAFGGMIGPAALLGAPPLAKSA